MKFLRAIFGRNAEEVEKPAAFAEPGPDPVMAALAELEVKRLRQALAAASQQRPAEPDSDSEFHGARPNRVVKTKMSLPDGVKAPSVNIWDLDDADVMPVRSVAPVSAPAMSNVRPARSKTRVLGFDAQPTSVVPLFDDTEAPVADTAARQGYVMFPAGWLAGGKVRPGGRHRLCPFSGRISDWAWFGPDGCAGFWGYGDFSSAACGDCL